MRSRDRSSSQIDTPASESALSRSFMISSPEWGGVGDQLGSADRDARLGLYICGTSGPAGCRMRGCGCPSYRIKAFLCSCDDRLRGEAKLFEQQASGRAGSIVIDADDSPGVADEVTPANANSGLDGDASLDLRRDDGVPVSLILLVEPLPTRHRHYACLDALVGELLLSCDGVLHLRAGSNQDHIRGAVTVFEYVTALGHF